MKNFIILAVFLFALCASCLGQVAVRATTPEQAGDEKAAAGEYAGAIALYQKQWISCAAGINEGNAETQATRERLAEKLGNTLTKYQKSPVLSDETELYALKGAAFVKNAKSPADYEKAVKEFQDAVNGAPWMFDYQFNLAVALKSAGQFKTALGYAKVAKLLAQTDKDRHDALALRAEIEAAGEMAASSNAEAAKQAEIKAKEQRISGAWRRPHALNDGVPRVEILYIQQASDGKWNILYDYYIDNQQVAKGVSHAGNDLTRVYTVVGGELHYRDVGMSYDNSGICRTYDVTGSVSADGNTLSLNYSLLPFAPDRPDAKCPARSQHKSEIVTYKR